MKTRPLSTEYNPFYETYVSLVPDGDILTLLRAQTRDIEQVFGGIAADKESFTYAPGKWTFRDVAGHLVDGERIFGMRGFCFSRGEQSPLPSFDQDAYVRAGRYGGVPLRDLIAELTTVRQANLQFLGRLNQTEWLTAGTASGKLLSVRAAGWILYGHVAHHLSVLREHYLPAVHG